MNLKKKISKILSLLVLVNSFSVTTLANRHKKWNFQPPPKKRICVKQTIEGDEIVESPTGDASPSGSSYDSSSDIDSSSVSSSGESTSSLPDSSPGESTSSLPDSSPGDSSSSLPDSSSGSSSSSLSDSSSGSSSSSLSDSSSGSSSSSLSSDLSHSKSVENFLAEAYRYSSSKFDVCAEDAANLAAIRHKMPDKKIIYLCPKSNEEFSQERFECALKIGNVPFEHYEYTKDKAILKNSYGSVIPDDAQKPVIYFGKNVTFSNHTDCGKYPGQKLPFAFAGYVINCDIIICGSELASINSICKNRIYGKCILYKPVAKQSSAFSTNLITEGLFVVGNSQDESHRGSKPISSGRAGFSTKHVRYLYGNGLMNDIFKNLEKPFEAEPTLLDTLNFVMSETDPKSKTPKNFKVRKKDHILDSDNLLYTISRNIDAAAESAPVEIDPDNNIENIKSQMRHANIIAFCPKTPTYFSFEKLNSALSQFSEDDDVVIYFGPNVVFKTSKRDKAFNTLFGGEKRDERYTIIFDRSRFLSDSIIHHTIPNSRLIFYKPNLEMCGACSRFFYDNRCSQLFVLHEYDREHPKMGLCFRESLIPNGVYYLHFGDRSSRNKLLLNVNDISNAADYLPGSTALSTFTPDFESFLRYALLHSPTGPSSEAVTE